MTSFKSKAAALLSLGLGLGLMDQDQNQNQNVDALQMKSDDGGDDIINNNDGVKDFQHVLCRRHVGYALRVIHHDGDHDVPDNGPDNSDGGDVDDNGNGDENGAGIDNVQHVDANDRNDPPQLRGDIVNNNVINDVNGNDLEVQVENVVADHNDNNNNVNYNRNGFLAGVLGDGFLARVLAPWENIARPGILMIIVFLCWVAIGAVLLDSQSRGDNWSPWVLTPMAIVALVCFLVGVFIMCKLPCLHCGAGWRGGNDEVPVVMREAMMIE